MACDPEEDNLAESFQVVVEFKSVVGNPEDMAQLHDQAEDRFANLFCAARVLLTPMLTRSAFRKCVSRSDSREEPNDRIN